MPPKKQKVPLQEESAEVDKRFTRSSISSDASTDSSTADTSALSVHSLADVSPLKRSSGSDASKSDSPDDEVKKKKRTTIDFSSYYKKYADIPASTRNKQLDGIYFVRICELGELICKSIKQEDEPKATTPPLRERFTKVVDSSMTFILYVQDSAWATKLELGQTYLINRPFIMANGVINVAAGSKAISKGPSSSSSSFATPSSSTLSEMLSVANEIETTKIATIYQLGCGSGLRAVRGKVVDISPLRLATATKYGPANKLMMVLQDGIDSHHDSISVTFFGPPADLAARMCQTGGSYTFTNMLATFFPKESQNLVLNSTRYTSISQIVQDQFDYIEEKDTGLQASIDVEAQILSVVSETAAIWPRCPTCFAKPVVEQQTSTYICNDTQYRTGCGKEYAIEDIRIGGTLTVMAFIVGQQESLHDYKIFSQSIAKLLSIPDKYDKSIDFVSRIDALNTPLSVKIKKLTSNNGFSFEILELIKKDGDDDQ